MPSRGIIRFSCAFLDTEKTIANFLELRAGEFGEGPLQHHLAPACSAASVLGVFRPALSDFIPLLLLNARGKQCLYGIRLNSSVSRGG